MRQLAVPQCITMQCRETSSKENFDCHVSVSTCVIFLLFGCMGKDAMCWPNMASSKRNGSTLCSCKMLDMELCWRKPAPFQQYTRVARITGRGLLWVNRFYRSLLRPVIILKDKPSVKKVQLKAACGINVKNLSTSCLQEKNWKREKGTMLYFTPQHNKEWVCVVNCQDCSTASNPSVQVKECCSYPANKMQELEVDLITS